jgi:hypothetical protein
MVAVMLDREQLRTFAERGFVVVPQVVPQELLATASRTIDELLGREPPPRDVRGPHFYLLEAATPRHCWRYSRGARRSRWPSR